MSVRLLFLAIILIGAGLLAYDYYSDQPIAVDVVDKARAMASAVVPAPGQPSDYSERVKDNAFDLASRERQKEGAAALGQSSVSGQMEVMIQLPSATPNGMDKARQISDYLLKKGFVQDIENRFPSIARTDSHSFALEAVERKSALGTCAAVHFTFLFSGYIRQGDPRKITDYADEVIEKEVGARCWNVPGYVANPPPTPITSPTAVVTDLPGEPDTAAAQAKLFKKPAPSAFNAPPSPVTSTQPSDSPVTAPADTSTPNYTPIATTSSGPTPSSANNSDSPTAGLHIRKQIPAAQSGTVYVNAMNYETLDEVPPTDTAKLLDQNGAATKNADGSTRGPLDQPVKTVVPVPADSQ